MSWTGPELHGTWTLFTPESHHYALSNLAELRSDSSRIESRAGLAEEPVLDVAQQNDGQLAVLQRSHVLVGELDTLRRVPLPSTLVEGADFVVWHGSRLLLAGAGGLWSMGGLTEHKSAEIEQLDTRKTDILWADSCDRVWAAGLGYVRCYHAHGELDFPLEVQGVGARVVGLAAGRDGCVYAAVKHAGLFVMHPERDEHFRLLHAIAHAERLCDVAIDHEGKLWVTLEADPKVRSMGHSGLASVTEEGALVPTAVHLFESGSRLLTGVDGRMWGVSSGHLRVRVGARWEREDYPGPPAMSGHYRLVRGARGCVWYATPAGLGRWLPELTDDEDATDLVLAQRFSIPVSPSDVGICCVIHVGWADARFDRKEASLLIKQLDRAKGDPFSRFAHLTMRACPGEDFFSDAVWLVRKLLAAMDDEHARRAESERVLAMATAMADASGGFLSLGFGNRICEQEAQMLESLKRDLA